MTENKSKKIFDKLPDTISYETTINLHSKCHRATFKRKGTKAIKAIKEHACKLLKTKVVKIDSSLNKFIYSAGISNIPYRVRVKMSRRVRDSDSDGPDGAKSDRLYTVVTYVPVDSFKGLQTVVSNEQ